MKLTVVYRPQEYNKFEARINELKQHHTLLRTSQKKSLYVRCVLSLFANDNNSWHMLHASETQNNIVIFFLRPVVQSIVLYSELY